ncbi:hypothetical protein BDV95DRAFT_673215 [Massariosphaeria phaeospora]|uniref:DEAD-box helicase OB fold domain-containing protein n=1 Tax=Massariosphaeria phaeospora TaxID=100035 RepID=A0A7C8I0J8_9PLEO|nr:hypothetical protein BDV95DRAFT_673215 [Massariosphaeria phaeospora]
MTTSKMNVEAMRIQMLKLVGRTWRLEALNHRDPEYYPRVLKALAAGAFLRVAKRRPNGDGSYETVRGGNVVSLARETKIATWHNEWVFYEEIHTTQKGNVMRLATGIPPEILVHAAPQYWWDVEFIPEGHIKDTLVKHRLKAENAKLWRVNEKLKEENTELIEAERSFSRETRRNQWVAIADVGQLHKALSDANHKIAVLEDEYSLLKAEKEKDNVCPESNLHEQIEELKKEKGFLAYLLADAESNLDAAKDNIELINQENTSLRLSNKNALESAASQEPQSLLHAIKQLKLKHTGEIAAKNEEFRQKLASVERKHRAEIGRYKKASSWVRFQDENARLAQDCAIRTDALEDIIAAKDREIKRCKEELVAQSTKLVTENADLKRDLANLKCKHNGLQDHYVTAETVNSELRDEITRLLQDAISSAVAKVTIEHLEKQLRTKAAEHTTFHSRTKTHCEAQDAKIVGLTWKVEALTAKIKELTAKNAELTAKNLELMARIARLPAVQKYDFFAASRPAAPAAGLAAPEVERRIAMMAKLQAAKEGDDEML